MVVTRFPSASCVSSPHQVRRRLSFESTLERDGLELKRRLPDDLQILPNRARKRDPLVQVVVAGSFY